MNITKHPSTIPTRIPNNEVNIMKKMQVVMALILLPAGVMPSLVNAGDCSNCPHFNGIGLFEPFGGFRTGLTPSWANGTVSGTMAMNGVFQIVPILRNVPGYQNTKRIATNPQSLVQRFSTEQADAAIAEVDAKYGELFSNTQQIVAGIHNLGDSFYNPQAGGNNFNLPVSQPSPVTPFILSLSGFNSSSPFNLPTQLFGFQRF